MNENKTPIADFVNKLSSITDNLVGSEGAKVDLTIRISTADKIQLLGGVAIIGLGLLMAWYVLKNK